MRDSFNQEKLAILTYFQQCQNVRQTAQHFPTQHKSYQPNQIRKWLQDKTYFEIKAKLNPYAFTLHNGRAVDSEAFEIEVYDWILAQRQAESSVRTAGIICKAFSLYRDFKKKRTLPCVQ